MNKTCSSYRASWSSPQLHCAVFVAGFGVSRPRRLLNAVYLLAKNFVSGVLAVWGSHAFLSKFVRRRRCVCSPAQKSSEAVTACMAM